jgi:tryptophanyl-tRNA synthetase
MVKRILTGIQPSGKLHLGNYFGAMKPMIDFMQKDKNDDIFCFVADYHALTTIKDPEELFSNRYQVVLDWLACGLDPNKINFYFQSDLPEVQELAWFLHSICPMGLLERSVSYREKKENGLDSNSALFNYPVLMAADILIMQSDFVPVGKDQKQHLEITRDLAIKFNYEFGNIFKVPEPIIKKENSYIPGIDGRKMSKSYKNTIELFPEDNILKKQVMSIVTDSRAVSEPKDHSSCNIFQILSLFLTEEEKENLIDKYKNGGLSYGEIKKDLLVRIQDYFSDFRKKRETLKNNPNYLRDIMNTGKNKVKPIAQETIFELRSKIGFKKV